MASQRQGTIVFVIPWYPEHVSGGAEMLCKSLVQQLTKRGYTIEVLTTCVKEFRSDWNKNYWKQGTYTEDGATIRRFPVRKRNVAKFDTVNCKLMHGERVSGEEERTFIKEMIHSPKLVTYLNEHKDEYKAIVALPYMFGTTLDVLAIAPEKTFLLPCFHDEPYAYMKTMKRQFSAVQHFFFNADAEQRLAERLYDISHADKRVIGSGIEPVQGDSDRFRERYGIPGDYILYVGRKDAGKNVYMLADYFERYVRDTGSDLTLVLIGSGRLELPESVQEHIWDLGFVSTEDKHDAFAGALMLCNPSVNESFSIVLMESWSVGRPVLVHANCTVTREHVHNAQGGLVFRNYEEFRDAVEYIDEHRNIADSMGLNGKRYFEENFTHDTITKRYVDALFNAA